MRKISDVMTKDVRTCEFDTTLVEVAKVMLDEDTGFVPILKNGELQGVITDRDIVVRAVAKGVDANKEAVGNFLSQNLVCLTPDQELKDGIRMMEEHQIRRLCVIESQGSRKLVGVVSLGDLAEVPEASTEEALQEISKSPKTLSKAQ